MELTVPFHLSTEQGNFRKHSTTINHVTALQQEIVIPYLTQPLRPFCIWLAHLSYRACQILIIITVGMLASPGSCSHNNVIDNVHEEINFSLKILFHHC